MTVHGLMLFIHIAAAIVFIGNIVITFFWKIGADRTGNRPIVAFSQTAVNRLDWIFTLPGAVLLGVSGGYLAHATGTSWMAINWMTVGVFFFVLSGIVWAHMLLPLQKRQLEMISQAEGDDIPTAYVEMCSRWNRVGNLATLLAVIALFVMVTKPF